MPDDSKRQILGVNPATLVPPIGEQGVIGFTATALGNALLCAISGAPVVVVVDLDLADDEVAIGGPDSGGTRRLFQGRVDGANNIIESVPVLSGAQALALGKVEDTAHVTGDVGAMMLAVRQDAPAVLAGDGDYIPLIVDATGNLRVAISGTVTVSGTVAVGPTVTPGTGATNLGKAEDAVAASGDVGVMALSVRRDADAADAADGDYVPLHTNSVGRLKVDAANKGTTATQTITAVAAVSVSIAAALATRRAITIQNRGPGPLSVNPGGAAVATGFRIAVGESKTFQASAQVAWTGISNATGASAVVISENN